MTVPVSVPVRVLPVEYQRIKSQMSALECKVCIRRVAVCAGCVLFCCGSVWTCCNGGNKQPFSDTEWNYCHNMCWQRCCEDTEYYLLDEELEIYRDNNVRLPRISHEMEISRQVARRVFPDLGGETSDGLTQMILDYQREPSVPSSQRMS